MNGALHLAVPVVRQNETAEFRHFVCIARRLGAAMSGHPKDHGLAPAGVILPGWCSNVLSVNPMVTMRLLGRSWAGGLFSATRLRDR